MIGLRIEEEFLDLQMNTSVSFVINTPIFTGDKFDTIEGSYSLPFTVPMNGKNRRLLEYPDLIEKYNSKVIKDCTFYGEGVPLYSGKLYVLSCNSKEAKLNMIISGISDFPDKSLKDIDMGTHEVGFWTEMRDHAVDTLYNSNNHDHVFAPLYNKHFYEDVEDYQDLINDLDLAGQSESAYGVNPVYMQNPWHDGEFILNIILYANTPFLKVEKVLKSIMEDMGFSIENQFQTNEELRNLLLYTNNSINQTGNILPNSFEKARQAPDISVKDFVKAICRYFFLAIVPDNAKKVMLVIPLRSIVEEEHKHNWTDKTLKGFEIEEGKDTEVNAIVPQADPNAINETGYTEIEYNGEVETITAVPGDDEKYYVQETSSFWSSIPGAAEERFFLPLRWNEEDPLKTESVPLSPTYVTNINTLDSNTKLPQVAYKGNFAFVNPENGELFKESKNAVSARIFFYRGPDNSEATDTPYSNHTNYFDNHLDWYQYSLNFTGVKGIKAVWAQKWLDFLENKRMVKRIAMLHITDILNFKPIDKVRIENINYFVVQMKITFTQQGLKPSELLLASTL